MKHSDEMCSLEETGLGSTPAGFNTLKVVLAGTLTIPFPIDEGKLVAS